VKVIHISQDVNEPVAVIELKPTDKYRTVIQQFYELIGRHCSHVTETRTILSRFGIDLVVDEEPEFHPAGQSRNVRASFLAQCPIVGDGILVQTGPDPDEIGATKWIDMPDTDTVMKTLREHFEIE
jgi:hypothetical protein